MLGEDKLYPLWHWLVRTHLARAVAELRTSILPSPATGVQNHEGLLTTENSPT